MKAKVNLSITCLKKLILLYDLMVEITQVIQLFAMELNLNLNPTIALDFLPRFISELKLSTECEKLAKKIIKKEEMSGLTSGRGPTGVCGAAIYAATILTKERRTQREIARISRVTEVTVRNRFSELVENLNLGISIQK